MSDPEMLGRSDDTPARSIGEILRSQYKSNQFNDIFGATELREYEILTMSMLYSSRFVAMVLSTTEKTLERLTKGTDQYTRTEELLDLRERIMNDDNAMVFVLEDSFLFFFGLARKSLKRKSRAEAVSIATSPSAMINPSQVGVMDRFLSTLGVSKKYQRGYVEKD